MMKSNHENYDTATIDRKLQEIRKKYYAQLNPKQQIRPPQKQSHYYKSPLKVQNPNLSKSPKITSQNKKANNGMTIKTNTWEQCQKYLPGLGKQCQSTTSVYSEQKDLLSNNFGVSNLQSSSSIQYINKRIQDILSNVQNRKILPANETNKKCVNYEEYSDGLNINNQIECNNRLIQNGWNKMGKNERSNNLMMYGRQDNRQQKMNYNDYEYRKMNDLNRFIEQKQIVKGSNLKNELQDVVNNYGYNDEYNVRNYENRKNYEGNYNKRGKQINDKRVYWNNKKFEPIQQDQCQIEKNQTKKFINTLQNQIKIDQQLRNYKIQLEHHVPPQNQDKWQLLKIQYQNIYNTNSQQNQKIQHPLNTSSNYLPLTFQQFKQSLKNTQHQHNPFYSKTQQQRLNYQNILQKYIQSQSHWKNHIINAFQISKFKAQAFSLQSLDLEAKGYITMLDFVRFMNIETGVFYRMRDLMIVWKRIVKQSKKKIINNESVIEFQQLLQLICRK